ncbi:hypothetical protein [Serratia fonticola]|uniref:hypothetical protein n=1 Tax=Serratia fonticola TaxID=47917 RepID=UPI002177CD2F|nr:hypothetical protein [Serratia fonticola]CAI1847840.1 Uncharacterised protein [Serratia fonticola]
MKQNPFSFYDFLGYLIPGASLLYLFYFGGMHYGWKISGEAKTFMVGDNSSLSELLNFLPFVILSYISGHLLSLLSSFLIEKYSNCKNGYPSQYLISDRGNGYFYNSGFLSIIGRCILFLIVLPISLLDLLTGFKFRQNKQMDDRLRPVVFKACKEVLNEKFLMKVDDMDDSKGIDGDSFRLIYHYSFENSEPHAAKLQNYVALYGFTRNIAMVFIITFWTLVTMKFVFDSSIGYRPIFFSGILSFIFYKGFVKFYKRYTLEAMMAACAIKAKEKTTQ